MLWKIRLNNFVKFFIIISGISIALVVGCNRSPIHLPHGRRTRGDNGYKLIVANSLDGYEPGKTYNVLLQGLRTHERVQHFTHFLITAEAYNHQQHQRPIPSKPQRVGYFQLFTDGLTKFSDRCINTVGEVDDLPKTEIQIMWVAPVSGSGCVAISAMVYEGPHAWYSDDGQLSQVICQKISNENSIHKECCACDEAKYNGIWSNETHPKDYPFAVWLTHFSDIVGATHEASFSFWGENHIATDGFRSLAEFGSPSALESELRSKGSRLRTLIKAAGLWYPNVNTNTSSNFRVDRKHHKVSMVSMFGPSPDWIVGINGIDLCTEDCSWKESLAFDLYPWDAGTDSGISYMSANIETQPRERMYRITPMYPEDPRAPFYNPSSKDMIPLAKLYITRDKIIPRNCDDSFLEALQSDINMISEDQDDRNECRVTKYSSWSACSVTCGKGIRMRTRQYLDPQQAALVNCTNQLVFKEMCAAAIAECSPAANDEDETENLAKSLTVDSGDSGGSSGICQTTQWSAWSECSASCGIGITMRTRSFYNHLGRKRCTHINVVEKQKCMKPECTYEQIEVPDPLCPTSQWSDWSPCSATCGKGVTIRTRFLLLENDTMKENCGKRIELHQQKQCNTNEDCLITAEVAKEICSLRFDGGPCRGKYLRYAYNIDTGTCEPFNFGGCRGNRNNFLTIIDCMNTCNKMQHSTGQIATFAPNIAAGSYVTNNSLPIDCVISKWTNWSECSAQCGSGYSERYRYIISEAKNGGIECPKHLLKRRRCTVANC